MRRLEALAAAIAVAVLLVMPPTASAGDPSGSMPVRDVGEGAATDSPGTRAIGAPVAADLPATTRSAREVVVMLAPGVSPADAAAAIRAAGGTITSRADAIGALAVDAGSPAERAALRARLALDGRFASVEPAYLLHAAAVPNDPMLTSEWWLDSIDVRPTWDWPAPSSSVTIGIVDSGVDLTHPDLQGVLLPGRNFVDPGRDPRDDMPNGHGTHVAGIAAAEANNGVGIAGVASGARILPVKILDATGNATDATAAAGITWAADQGVKVINLSLEGAPVDPCPSALVAAVEYARSKNVVVVAASGNGGTAVSCPARIPGVVAVGAVAQTDAVWARSNRGPQLSVTAPGVLITSTIPVGMGSYGELTGTSMAAPVVSGVAAILAGAAPGLDEAGIRAAIVSTARDVGPTGRDDTYGAGIVDAGAALVAAAEPLADVTSAPAVIAADGSGVADEATLSFRVRVPVTASVTVERVDGTTVRTLEPGPLAAGAQSLAWDGRDEAGARLPDGDYRFAIRGTAPGGVAVTITRPVAVSAALVSARTTPAMISPNGDGKADRTTVSFTLRGAADVSVSVRDGSGRTVRTLARGPRIAGVGSVAWDGRAGSTATSRTVPQGSYTIDVSATTASGTWSIQLPVAVSVSGVAVSGLAATPVFPFADGYRDESSISFTQAGPATSTVYLYRAGSTKAYRALPQGRLSKGRATASWDGRDAAGRVAAPGTYRVRVRTVDPAGVVRWSAYGSVTVSAKRLYPAVFTATLSGDQRSTASFASLPDAAAVEPSPAPSRGVRLRSDVSGEFAVGVWTFAHPAWTQVTSAIVWIDCVRDADGDTDVGAWTGFDVVGGGTIGGTGGRVENLLSPSSIPTGSRDVSVAVRQSGPGRVDIATVTIEVRYTFLR